MTAVPREERKLSSSQRLQLEALCDEFEVALRAGSAPPIAEVLADTSGLFRTTLAYELLAVELEHRVARGEHPRPEDYHHMAEVPAEAAAPLLARFCPARYVAHFELLERLGEGAFGTVWKARDTRLGRPVALKIAHPRRVEDAESFLREARATARLQHPNIVRVLDVGEHAGQLFIVREFVEGRPLGEVLREGPTDPHQAAEVCELLAGALAHSHALGCVHRDIKPANVLLDAAGVPHLLDFGLAKFAAPNVRATRTGDMLGTPAYMSPEQARGDSRSADARTDVYSLGVVLYEMLTGERPFRGTLEMTVVQILHDDPPHPVRLRRDIPADLATVCLKCLEKDPTRRYAGAAELAADLGRFRAGRPIVARPVTVVERGFRWARRNPATAALTLSSLVLAALLVAGTVFWSITLKAGWDKERALHARADEARARATRAAEQARAEAVVSAEVTEFLERVFAPSDPLGQLLGGVQPGATDSRTLVRRASERIEQELAGQPRVQARLMDSLGNVLCGMGEFDDAGRLLARAAELRADLLRQDPTPQPGAEQARNHLFRGRLHQALGRHDEALACYRQAHEQYKQVGGPESLPVAEVEFYLGWLHLERREPGPAKVHFTRALEIRTRCLPAGHPLIVHAEVGLVQCDGGIHDLATLAASAERTLGKELAGKALALAARVQLARRTGDRATAREGYRELVALVRSAIRHDHPVTALVLGDHASFLWEAGDYPQALEAVTEALRIGRRFAPRHPRLLQALKHVAFELLLACRWEEAERLYREALAFPNQPNYQRAEITHGLIWCCLQTGRPDEALAFAEETVERSRGGSLEFSCWSRYCLARILTVAGRADEARAFDAEALRLAREIDLTKQSPLFLDRFAVVFAHNGERETAEQLLRRALEQEQQRRPADHPRVADRLHALGSFLLGQGREAEAAPLLRRALAIREQRLPPDDHRRSESHKQVARLHPVP